MKWTIIFLTILLFILPTAVRGSENQSHWDQNINNVLEYINNNNLEAADYLLNNTFSQFQKSNLPVGEAEILEPVFLQAMEAIENEKDMKQNILRLQLALDAKNSTYQPMWVNRENEIVQTFAQMEEALQKNDMTKFEQSFAMFQEQYQIISPSLSLDLRKQEFSQLQANILYVEEHMDDETVSLNSRIQQLRKELISIFAKYSGETNYSSIFWMSAIVGSVIAISLLYAGIKKYFPYINEQ